MSDIYWIDGRYVVKGPRENKPSDAVEVPPPTSHSHDFDFEKRVWFLPDHVRKRQALQMMPSVEEQLDAILEYLMVLDQGTMPQKLQDVLSKKKELSAS